MNRRSVLLLVATLVAVIGTALVFVYVRNADNRAISQYDTVNVLTAVEPIAPGESIEDAQSAGKLKIVAIPNKQVLSGALDSTSSLEGQVAVTTIFPGEQIIPSKFGGQATSASPLAIPEDMQAVSVELTDPGRVAGFVNPGSYVAIYHQKPEAKGGDVMLLLKRVLVLGVGDTSTTTKTTTTTTDGAQTTEEVPKTLLTLAVDQADAEKVLFATSQAADHGDLAFALLTDKSKTTYTHGASWANLYN